MKISPRFGLLGKPSKIKGAIMPVQGKYEHDDIYVLRISGILKRSEFGAGQRALTRNIDIGWKASLARHS